MTAYILLALAAVLLAAGCWLWMTGSQAKPAPRSGPVDASDAGPVSEADAVEDFVVEAVDVEPEPEPEPEPAPAAVSAPEPAAEFVPSAPEPAPEPAPAPIPESAREPVQEPAREPAQPRPHRMSGLQLPGASRRERRAWAEQHGFSFAKTDELLASEWSRGAAAAGAQPRDVVAGQAYGHDVFVADLGGVTVIAAATGECSDVVVDMRRVGYSALPSEDLQQVAQVEQFVVFANEPGPAQRFLDVRVATSLRELPAAVTAVWCESSWVLVELGRGAAPQDWDAVLAPLALLADAARTLPPREALPLELEPQVHKAQGEQPEQSARELEGPELLVRRPEEPMVLPTRVTGGGFGEVGDHEVGDDSVEPIGASLDDSPGQVTDLTRARRKLRPSAIFPDDSDEAVKEHDDER